MVDPYFSRALNSKKINNNHTKTIVGSVPILLIVLFIVFPSVECKQTIFAESLASKNDKILVKLLKETHNYIEFQRYVSSVPFKCRTVLKNELTKNVPENISRIQLHLDYAQVMSLNSNQILLGFEPSELNFIKKIDKVLDILNGQCLYYTTNTFIYEYCHKEHVRQFDSHYTKAANVKAQYQDISMGVYNPEEHNNRKKKKGFVQLTEEERKVRLPELSDFSQDYNFLQIQGIDKKFGKIQVQESEDGNLLFSNVHLIKSDKYFTDSPILLKILCYQRQFDTTTREITNYALVVDPYTLVYTSKQGKCDRYEGHQLIPHQVRYQDDSSEQPIRVYGKYLYGNVQQICTNKWAWQRTCENEQFDVTLQEGSLLFLEVYNSKQKQVEYHYAIVSKVISASLIQLDTALGKSFKIPLSFQSYINRTTIKSQRLIGNITKCELMFNKNIDFSRSAPLSYVGNGILKIDDSKTPIRKGDNIGCICKSAVQNHFKIIDVDITISNHLWSSYYQAFIKSNTNIFTTPNYPGKEYLLRQCHDYNCFFFAEKEKNSTNIQQKKRFTEIVKLSTKNQRYQFNQSDVNHFYVLTIKRNGIIKLTTRSKNGQIYTYLITQGQIIKKRQFENGTKEIIKQNKYYENSTIASNNISNNYIYIKLNRLLNGSYYGGIWKVQDFVYFPRFLLFDEELIQLQRMSGFAYIRILKLENLRDREHMAVIKYMKKLERHYSMKEKLAEDPNSSLFLNKSYSINYNYVSGKYCSAPVNKFRKTTVQLKCGNPWFAITKLLETSPCEYWIQIQTTLLCRQGYKQVVESDDSLYNRHEGIISNNGIFCHPAQGLLDEAPPYLYLQKSVQ